MGEHVNENGMKRFICTTSDEIGETEDTEKQGAH